MFIALSSFNTDPQTAMHTSISAMCAHKRILMDLTTPVTSVHLLNQRVNIGKKNLVDSQPQTD